MEKEQKAKLARLAGRFVLALAIACLACGGLIYAGSRLTARIFNLTESVTWPNDQARQMRAKIERDRPAGVAALYNGPHEIIFSTPDGRQIECGLRSDGVVVWRERKK